jgi:diphthine synthase
MRRRRERERQNKIYHNSRKSDSMLYLIGIGLHDEKDLPLRAIETIKKCDDVFCELYTNKWLGSLDKLSEIVGKKIHVLERLQVESDFLIQEAKKKDVALLIPGDPLTATTHIGLVLEAKKHKIKTEIIHASSVYTAIAQSGLQLYKFGRSTTLVFPEEKFKPESPYDVIKKNQETGLHTLVLLDIRYDEEKYMTANEGLGMLLEAPDKIIDAETNVVVCCQMGGEGQTIKYGKIKTLIKDKELNIVPAVILIPGQLNFKEIEALGMWKVS